MSRKHTKSINKSPESASERRLKLRKRNRTWLWVGLGVLLVAVVGILLFSSHAVSPTGNSPSPVASSIDISPAQAYTKYQQGAFFLDVRTQAEWNQFHLAKSTLIPLDQLQNRLSELPKNQDIIVVCLTGHRSQSGVAILQQAGFTHVSDVSGGLQAWIAAGYPVQGTPP